ncbi:MAG: acyl-CoA dehydrogenase family protein [Candidatus Aminicenantes bacterium]|nr:acyl-CoA dehydrogenase family protein [Candidatus Aminicenantes bacterium]
MNFELNEDQLMLRELVRDFSQKEIAPKIGAYEEQHQFPRDIIRQLSEIGVLGMTVPPELGGNRTDYLSFILALEELAKVSATVCVIVSVHASLFCNSILKFGSDRQKEKYLPAAARGEIIGAFSLTEPEAGSDATGIKSRAVKSGGEYILNGTKAWVTAGNDADALIIIAKTRRADGEEKLSAFIVDKDSPGLKVTKIEEKMGLHSSPTAMLSLEDCRVPAENRLGEEGRGAAIALSGLDGSRIGVAAQALGLSQRALDLAVGYARQREAFGKKIAEFQALQFMMADIATWVEAGRLLTYSAAALYDRGRPFTKEAAMAKLFTSEAANKIAYLALQIHGGYGYSREYPIERIYRDARVLSIYEGTSEIQRLVIARSLLKEP